MSLLFVDFDGVLHRRPRPHEVSRHYAQLFEHVELLATALEPFPAVRIVVSSSWRLSYGPEELRASLGPLGPRIKGSTGPVRNTRYMEIAEAAGSTLWVAIDDDLRGWPLNMLDRVVQCDPYQGLGEPGKAAELMLRLRTLGQEA